MGGWVVGECICVCALCFFVCCTTCFVHRSMERVCVGDTLVREHTTRCVGDTLVREHTTRSYV